MRPFRTLYRHIVMGDTPTPDALDQLGVPAAAHSLVERHAELIHSTKKINGNGAARRLAEDLENDLGAVVGPDWEPPPPPGIDLDGLTNDEIVEKLTSLIRRR